MLDNPCALVCQQAGGCPAASNFLLSRQKKVTKEKATRWSGSLRFATGNLRCSQKMGSSSNSPSAQTIASPDPFVAALLGPARRVGRQRRQTPIPNSPPESLKRAALQGRDSQRTVMFARECSARGQMRTPSIAQRGEGGARGGSGESDLLSTADHWPIWRLRSRRLAQSRSPHITLALNQLDLVPIRISHKSNHGGPALDRAGFARHVAAG